MSNARSHEIAKIKTGESVGIMEGAVGSTIGFIKHILVISEECQVLKGQGIRFDP